jgi:hypothetical protein
VAPASIHREPAPTSPPSTPALRRAARRFLGGFLALESGGAHAARAAIRRSAGRRLARELLAASPGGEVRRAIVPAPTVDLHLARLPQSPGLALATGTARRPDGPEPFAFLLARRDGRWLAVAPAE